MNEYIPLCCDVCNWPIGWTKGSQPRDVVVCNSCAEKEEEQKRITATPIR